VPGRKDHQEWDTIQISELVEPLVDKNEEAQWKKSVAPLYHGLGTETQRIHIDDIVWDRNQMEENPFVQWRLGNIKVMTREIEFGVLRGATEAYYIRVIFKRVPRGCLELLGLGTWMRNL
jgi:hypothetical protein